MDREEGTRKTAEEIAKLSAEYIKKCIKIAQKNGIETEVVLLAVVDAVYIMLESSVYKVLEKQIEEEEKKCLS